MEKKRKYWQPHRQQTNQINSALPRLLMYKKKLKTNQIPNLDTKVKFKD